MGKKAKVGVSLLGPAIEKRRQQLGLRWQEVAARADISRTTLRFLVRGVAEPRWATIEAIARALETSAWNLLRGDAPVGETPGGHDPFVDRVCEAIGRLPPNRLIAVAQIVDAIAEAPADTPPAGMPLNSGGGD